MAYINVIDYPDSEGQLKSIYEELIQSRGKLAEVHKIQSLNPATIPAHMDLYMKIMFSKSPLRRYEREMVAVIVSKNNQCPYCVKHHGEALLHYWKDQARFDLLVDDYTKANLNPKELALCQFAEQMTLQPNSSSQTVIDQLKAVGLDDRAVLDLMLVIAYFNFVNRMVLGLGVQLETDEGKGYKY